MPKIQTEASPSETSPILAGPKPMTDAEAVGSLTLDQRFALVSFTATLGEQEADRLWKRFGIMLTLNAGLLAIASFTISNNLEVFTAAITVLGLVLTIFWYRIVSLSQFYEERWRKDLAAIINCDEVLTTLLRSRSKLGARIDKPVGGSSTEHAKFMVLIVGLFWMVLTITIYLAVWHQATSAPASKPNASTQPISPPAPAVPTP
jgi:hypothetical protein